MKIFLKKQGKEILNYVSTQKNKHKKLLGIFIYRILVTFQNMKTKEALSKK